MRFQKQVRFLCPGTFSERGAGFNVIDCRDGGDAVNGALAIAEAESSHERLFIAIVGRGQELPYRQWPRVTFCMESVGDEDEGVDFFWLRDAAGKVGVYVEGGAAATSVVARSCDAIVAAGGSEEWARGIAIQQGVLLIER